MGRVDFSQEWRIVTAPQTDPVGDYAVTELRRVLEKITGVSPAITSIYREGLPSIVLKYGREGGDAFTWQAVADHIEISGNNPRALLFGVYDFLEALGCAWVKPGSDGERLPSGTMFELPSKKVSQKPAFADRALIIGHAAFMNDIEDWMRWAVRNRINTLFFHTTGDPLAMGGGGVRHFHRHNGNIARMKGHRGFTLEHGGHGLSALLPRSFFGQMPDAFRMKDGARTPDHNFCVHHAEGMKIIRQNAAAYFKAHPEADVFHLWPDDIPGGGWCGCERCRDYSSSDQALIATNALAEELSAIAPTAKISFLAYHDTEAAPHKVAPRDNVALLWAPRLRSYAYAIDAADSKVNAPRFADAFRAGAAHFAKAKAQPPRVFEYYLDTVLFKSAVPPLPTVIKADLQFYKKEGAGAVGVLMTGPRPFFSAELNAWLFARLAWDPAQDLLGLIRTFYRTTFGTDDPKLLAYARALEKAFALALDFHPACGTLSYDMKKILETPPIDMGDPFLTPPEALADKVKAAEGIEALVAEAGKSLAEAEAAARGRGAFANGDPWTGEAKSFACSRLWLAFDLARLRLYRALNVEPFDSGALEKAEAALEAFIAFCDEAIADPALRANAILQARAFWGLRLARIRLDKVQKGLGALFLRLKVLLRLGRLARKVRNAYR